MSPLRRGATDSGEEIIPLGFLIRTVLGEACHGSPGGLRLEGRVIATASCPVPAHGEGSGGHAVPTILAQAGRRTAAACDHHVGRRAQWRGMVGVSVPAAAPERRSVTSLAGLACTVVTAVARPALHHRPGQRLPDRQYQGVLREHLESKW